MRPCCPSPRALRVGYAAQVPSLLARCWFVGSPANKLPSPFLSLCRRGLSTSPATEFHRTSITETVQKRVQAITQRNSQLEELLQNPQLAVRDLKAYASELKRTSAVVTVMNEIRQKGHELDQLQGMIKSEPDAEIQKMARDEAAAVVEQLRALEARLLAALVPKDLTDERSAILEVRAGAGGLEASLFADDIFSMYRQFAGLRRWSFEALEYNKTDVGGIREATALIRGEGAFGMLKYESGVHRVQRVPITGKGGVLHTSTITVAILPEAEEVDVQLDLKDLKIDVMRAGGAGGQHVNKTESAVRITHLPTGLVIGPIQDSRSQHQNKDRALKILRAKLFEREREALASARSSERRQQVGSGERGERIRTYNFPQDRVTDHRIGSSKHEINRVMSGELLAEFVNELVAWDQTNALKQLLAQDGVK